VKLARPSAQSPAAQPTLLDWVGVTVVTLCGALAGLLETLLVPLYVGAVVLPISVVFALATNVAFPRMARSFVPSTFAALAPFFAWLAVAFFFGSVARPEGDVILATSPHALEFVTYGLLLGGALAGTATVIWLTPPPTPVRPRRPNR
jgi:hypothetical protein